MIGKRRKPTPTPKPRKPARLDAELAYADAMFREALKGGDSATDAALYAQLMLDSAKLGH